MTKGIAVHILAFIPSTILGIIGGFLGALFNFINLKFARLRRRTLAKLKDKKAQNALRMAEPIVIMVRRISSFIDTTSLHIYITTLNALLL